MEKASEMGIVLIFLPIVMAALPKSPFRAFIELWDSIPELNSLNYFFPVTECLTVLEAWTAAIGIFYTVMLLARWIKMID